LGSITTKKQTNKPTELLCGGIPNQKPKTNPAIVPGASWSPYYCAPLAYVLNFLGGLAVWRFYKQTNKLSKTKNQNDDEFLMLQGPHVRFVHHLYVFLL